MKDRAEIIMRDTRYRLVLSKLNACKRCKACAFTSVDDNCNRAYDLIPCEQGHYPNQRLYYFKEVKET
jgi:hypothetical protein